MNRRTANLTLCTAAMTLLAACSTPTTQQAATIGTATTAVVTLAQAAGKNNATVSTVLAKGALVCGEASSVTGQLLQGTAVALLTAAGVPVSVTGQASSDVAAACSAYNAAYVPGPAPAGTTDLPAATVTTALPPVS